MAKKRFTDPTNCGYCGVWVEAPEDEHPFPQGWYQKGTRRDEMIVIPGCGTCNRSTSAVEERVRRYFSLSMDPKHVPSKDAMAATWRSLNPHGKDETSARYAFTKLADMRASLCVILAEEMDRVVPNGHEFKAQWIWDPNRQLWLRGTHGMQFNTDDVDIFLRKLTRGMFFHIYGLPLPKDVPIALPPMTDRPSDVAMHSIKEMGMNGRSAPSIAAGMPPAFEYAFINTVEDPYSSVWYFRIWNKIVFCAMTGMLAADGEGYSLRLPTGASGASAA